MNYAWLDDMLCSDDDNIIKCDTSFDDKMRMETDTEPEFLINLLKMLPQTDRHEDPCRLYDEGEIEQNMAMPALEELPSHEHELCENVCDVYREAHQRWLDEVVQMMHRFNNEGRLMKEVALLRAENLKLKADNAMLKCANWGVGLEGLPMLNGHEQLPQLLTPSNDISVTDEEDQAFDPQIDKAKLKTKLCKYFLQSNEHDACPFYRRHGWCAFAHGEPELSTPAHTADTPTSAPLSPLMLGSPSFGAMSPLSV